MTDEPFISEHDDGWYVYVPATRADGYGPLTMPQAEGVEHVVRRRMIDGSHSFTSCPRSSRSMCRWRDAVDGALAAVPELRPLLG